MQRTLTSLPSLPSLPEIKIDPAKGLMALGGVLIIAYALLGLSYSRVRGEQPQLSQQIEAGGGVLAGAGDSQVTLDSLRGELALTESSLTSLQTALPEKLDGATLVEGILGHAAQSHVSVQNMTASAPKELQAAAGQVGGDTYIVLSYSLTMQGALPDLLGFLSLVEADTDNTASVGNVALKPMLGGLEMTAAISFYAKTAAAQATPAPGAAAHPAGQ